VQLTTTVASVRNVEKEYDQFQANYVYVVRRVVACTYIEI